jgi:hypothetical protein
VTVETSLAEIILIAAAAYGLYRLLIPLQRRLERWLLLWLAPEKAGIIDAETVDDPPKKGRPKR